MNFIIRALFLGLLSTLLFGCAATNQVSRNLQKIQVKTDSGFTTEAWMYEVKENRKKSTVVYLHGKGGNPETEYSSWFIEKMGDAGYTVIAPLMPWSEKRRYEGTREQGLEVIDQIAAMYSDRQIVVIGHSMGGMAVLQYGHKGTADNIAGLIAVAPGHDPNVSGKIRSRTASEAQEACQKMLNGEGKARNNYPDRRGKKEYTISATAEYFCTYYSINQYPDSRDIGNEIKVPTLIVAGDSDPLTKVYSMNKMYERLPENPLNQYKLLSGEHKSVLYNNVGEISSWIDSLN